MTQKNLLFNFRLKLKNENTNFNYLHYNFRTGLWEDERRRPIIEKIIYDEAPEIINGSTVTKTRERIDQSEDSQQDYDMVAQTLITCTPEGVDRSERSK